MPQTTITIPEKNTINRRANLLLLVQEYALNNVAEHGATKGVNTDFAAKCEISRSLLSQLKGELKEGKPTKSISDKLAKQIENKFAKPVGWLDEVHEEQMPSSGEVAFLTLARETWHKQNARGKRTLMKAVKDFKADVAIEF
jgi:hypothetical protein